MFFYFCLFQLLTTSRCKSQQIITHLISSFFVSLSISIIIQYNCWRHVRVLINGQGRRSQSSKKHEKFYTLCTCTYVADVKVPCMKWWTDDDGDDWQLSVHFENCNVECCSQSFFPLVTNYCTKTARYLPANLAIICIKWSIAKKKMCKTFSERNTQKLRKGRNTRD